MIQMEYPKLPLDGLTPEEKVVALKRQVDILTDNLQIVLNSIEDDMDGMTDAEYKAGTSTTNKLITPARLKGAIQYWCIESLADHVVEQGTSGGWRYTKWDSGRVELWGFFSQSVTAYATNSFVIGDSSTTAYPFAITEPRAVVTGQKIGTGGCVVDYDYARTDYWSGIAHGTVTSWAQGSTQTITWTCYVNARWK